MLIGICLRHDPATVLDVLALFDTATGEVAPLEPAEPGRLSVYLCGPTVSGEPHLGHGRFCVVWDVLRRYLTWSGLEVRFVSNVTDIEDKIIARAAEEHSSTEEVARRYEALWWDVTGALGVKRPDADPHATAYVEAMVDLIADPGLTGHAYEGGDGVYFATDSVPGYGLLAHQDLATLRAGARVEVAERRPASAARSTSPYGSSPSRASRHWPSPWGRAGPAGTPSAW